MQKMRSIFTIATFVLISVLEARATVLFRQVGDDLVVEIVQEISLTITAEGREYEHGLLLDGIFSSPVAYSGRGIVFDNTIGVSSKFFRRACRANSKLATS